MKKNTRSILSIILAFVLLVTSNILPVLHANALETVNYYSSSFWSPSGLAVFTENSVKLPIRASNLINPIYSVRSDLQNYTTSYKVKMAANASAGQEVHFFVKNKGANNVSIFDGTINAYMVAFTKTSLRLTRGIYNANPTLNTLTNYTGNIPLAILDGTVHTITISVNDNANGSVTIVVSVDGVTKINYTDTSTATAINGPALTGNGSVQIGARNAQLIMVSSSYTPQADNSSFTTDQNTAYNGSVTATDALEGMLSYSVVTNPEHGTVTMNSAIGSYMYTPNTDYSGADSFTFKANNGTYDTNTATVNITVLGTGALDTIDILKKPFWNATASPGAVISPNGVRLPARTIDNTAGQNFLFSAQNNYQNFTTTFQMKMTIDTANTPEVHLFIKNTGSTANSIFDGSDNAYSIIFGQNWTRLQRGVYPATYTTYAQSTLKLLDGNTHSYTVNMYTNGDNSVQIKVVIDGSTVFNCLDNATSTGTFTPSFKFPSALPGAGSIQIFARCTEVVVGDLSQPSFCLNSMFADNMVLQRNADVNIWGNAISGRTITASIAGKEASVTASDNKFNVIFNDLPTGGPYTLTVDDGTQTLTVNNVMVGDVWILAGQSNMELKVSSLQNQSYIDNANYSNIRQFNQSRNYSSLPMNEVINGQWDVCNPQNVINYSAVGYFFAKTLIEQDASVPIGLVYTPYGATYAKSWMPKSSTDKLGIVDSGADAPYQLCNSTYNAMINPILPFAPKGVVWYQGESQPVNYGIYLTEIISSWRQGFSNSQLPFVIIQLPRYGTEENLAGWPNVREQQDNVTRNISNTILSVNIDLGSATNVHPIDKEPVGVRAANAALSKFYNVSGNLLSPEISNYRVSGNKIIVDFINTGLGLELRNGSSGFEICGSDNVYHTATVNIVSASRIEISSTLVNNPFFVRYAWADFPQVSLYSIDGYPAAPFRTTVNYGSMNVSALKIISNIQPNTTVEYFISELQLDTDTTVILTKADGVTQVTGNQTIGTGVIVKIYNNDCLVDSNKVVVYGDVDGDSDIDLSDLILVRNCLLEINTIADEYKQAADLYNEKTITLNDLVGIMSNVSENGEINQNLYY